MIGLDLLLTVAMAYVTYINYKAQGVQSMWTILAALCTIVNAHALMSRL